MLASAQWEEVVAESGKRHGGRRQAVLQVSEEKKKKITPTGGGGKEMGWRIKPRVLVQLEEGEKKSAVAWKTKNNSQGRGGENVSKN